MQAKNQSEVRSRKTEARSREMEALHADHRAVPRRGAVMPDWDDSLPAVATVRRPGAGPEFFFRLLTSSFRLPLI